jgi:hypothetical protein
MDQNVGESIQSSWGRAHELLLHCSGFFLRESEPVREPEDVVSTTKPTAMPKRFRGRRSRSCGRPGREELSIVRGTSSKIGGDLAPRPDRFALFRKKPVDG